MRHHIISDLDGMGYLADHVLIIMEDLVHCDSWSIYEGWMARGGSSFYLKKHSLAVAVPPTMGRHLSGDDWPHGSCKDWSRRPNPSGGVLKSSGPWPL